MRDPRAGGLRTALVFPLFLAGVAVLVGRLYNIQIRNHDYLVELARKQSETEHTLAARRGAIVDCNGVPLAYSLETPAIFVDPGIVGVPARIRRWLPRVLKLTPSAFSRFLGEQPDILDKVNDPNRERLVEVTRALAAFTGRCEETLLARLEAALEARRREAAKKAAPVLGIPEPDLYRTFARKTRFVWFHRPAGERRARHTRQLKLRGVCVRAEYARRASEGLTIGAWLGFVNSEGRGCEGLERRHENRLCGTPGLVRLSRDGRGKRIANSAEPDVPARHGHRLHLTVDSRIQRIVDREMDQLYADFAPTAASCIVMEPSTGRILAMDSEPGFDVAKKSQLSAAQLTLRLRNHPVQSVYEPGSTFKPFAVAAALELGLLTPETRIDCENGCWVYRNARGRRVRTLHDSHPHGVMPVIDVVVLSSNIGAAKIGLRLGARRLQEYLARYHFGKKLGIQLPAEEAGIVTPPHRWTDCSTTSVPMGQEIACTPLQLITAFCALVNGGELMQPYLVESIEDPNSHEPARPRRPRCIRRVIGAETSAVMRRILAQVVERGTGKRLRGCKYRIGGKTGTAQKSAPGGYSHEKYIASFVGFAPADQPRICVLVMVDEPSRGGHYGGTVAAPTVGRIIDGTLSLLESAPPNTSYAAAAAAAPAIR